MVALTVQLTDSAFSDLLRLRKLLTKTPANLTLADFRDCARITKVLQAPVFTELAHAAEHLIATNAEANKDMKKSVYTIFLPIPNQEPIKC